MYLTFNMYGNSPLTESVPPKTAKVAEKLDENKMMKKSSFVIFYLLFLTCHLKTHSPTHEPGLSAFSFSKEVRRKQKLFHYQHIFLRRDFDLLIKFLAVLILVVVLTVEMILGIQIKSPSSSNCFRGKNCKSSAKNEEKTFVSVLCSSLQLNFGLKP